MAAAKLCLLNPQRKEKYDAALRQQVAAGAPSAPGQGSAGLDPSVSELIKQTDSAGSAQPPGVRTRTKLVVAGALAAAVAAAAVVAAIAVWPRDSGMPVSDAGLPAPDGSAVPGTAPKLPEESKTAKLPSPGLPQAKSPAVAPKPIEPQKGDPGAKPPVKPAPEAGKTPASGSPVPAKPDELPPWPETAKDPSKPPTAPQGDPKPPEPPPGPEAKSPPDEKTPPGPKVPPVGPGPFGKKPAIPPPRPKPALERVPVPPDAEQEKARRLVLEVHQKELDAATAPEDKLALARKFLDRVQQEENGAPERFVLLQMARDLAEQGRDWETAAEAINELDAGFQIEAVQMKAEVLEGFSKLTRTLPEHTAIAEAALPLIEEAAAKEDYALAGRLAKLAQSEAAKARSRDLQVAARAAGKRAQEVAKAAEQVRAARETLKANPSDPAANLTVGKYLCFVREDWRAGLPLLALSGDETLKAIAQKDMAPPRSPEEMAALGSQWWDLGEKEEAAGQRPFRLRAAHWYHAAVEDLPQGLTREMVESRLEEVAPLEALARSGSAARKGPYRAYEGTWIIRFENGRGRRYVIEATGEVSWGPYRGHLSRLKGDVVVDLQNGALDRLRLARPPATDSMLVEHFAAMASFPDQPTWRGEGRRLRKDRTETPTRLLRSLQGLWLIQFGDKTARAYAIDPKGNVLAQTLDAKGNVANPQDKRQGRLNVRDGEIVLDFQDGTLERLERVGPGLWVEYFRPPTEYPHTFLLFGVGVKK